MTSLLAMWVLLAVSTACSPDAGPPPPPAPALRVSLSQPRFDEGTRTLRVAVINEGTVPITVSSAGIASAAFEPHLTSVDDGVTEAGAIAGFVVQHGDAVCDAAEDAPVSLVVMVDGDQHLLPVEEDDAALLHRLHEQDCRQQRLDAAVSVTLQLGGQTVRRDGEEYLPGALVIRRYPDATTAEPVTVLSFRGSVLLSLRPDPRLPGGTLPVTLSPSADRLAVPVLVGSEHRCDAHALSGSTQTFLLSSFVRIGAHPSQRVTTIVQGATRARLAGIIDRDCPG